MYYLIQIVDANGEANFIDKVFNTEEETQNYIQEEIKHEKNIFGNSTGTYIIYPVQTQNAKIIADKETEYLFNRHRATWMQEKEIKWVHKAASSYLHAYNIVTQQKPTIELDGEELKATYINT